MQQSIVWAIRTRRGHLHATIVYCSPTDSRIRVSVRPSTTKTAPPASMRRWNCERCYDNNPFGRARSRFASRFIAMRLPVVGGTATFEQERFESVRIQQIKGSNNHIGGQLLTVGTYADAPHAGIARSFDAGNGVFDNDAPVRGCTDPRRRCEIDFWIRFAPVDIFRGDDALEKMSSRQSLQDCLDIRPRR